MTWMKDAKFWIGCAIGLIIGSAVATFSHSAFPSPKIVLGETAVSTTTPDSVTSSDQGAGDKVYVPHVAVSAPTWVAVRENNNGVSGRILGAQRVDAGTHENILVDLLRPTSSQTMYAVVLYTDNGDGEFDPKADELVLQGDGEPVLSQFVAK